MNKKELIIITIIIGICMVAAAGIFAYGMMNAHDVIVINSTNGTNTSTHTNMTNNTTVVEHVNHEDTSSQEVSDTSSQEVSQSQSQSQAHDDGFNHYTDSDGNAMVGNPNGQHMSEAQHQYVLANGML